MNIYIASSWKNQHAVEMLTDLLEKDGNTVFSFVRAAVNSEGRDNLKFDFVEWINSEDGHKKFIYDTDSAGLSDLVIYISPSGSDAWAEIGVAWASGVPVYGLIAKSEQIGLMRRMMTRWFTTHTWNPIKGKCFHDCSYCYMKRFKLPELYLDEKELKTDLGQGNFIFIGSGTDMFTNNVPSELIFKVFNHCKKFENKYLFQTKNPAGMIHLFPLSLFPPASVFGTTIETNRHYENIMFNAPTTQERATYMSMIHGCEKMLTIEPIMDFDEEPMLDMIKMINPFWINIGADSKGHNLPEPPAYKIESLLEKLKKMGMVVKIKSNLKRILAI